MFNDGEWSALISKLTQLTETNRVTWALDGHSLSLEVGDVTYVITSEDADGVRPWILSVRKGTDSEWSEIDSITSGAGWDDADPRVQLQGLRDIAYRMALGGPQLAQSLLEDMNKIDPTPAPPPEHSPF